MEKKILTSFLINRDLVTEVKKIAHAKDLSLGHALREGARMWRDANKPTNPTRRALR